MTRYKICIIGGHCGTRMFIIMEYLEEYLKEAGYPCHMSHHSVWESYTVPPGTHLVLQLLPAFTEREAGCPVINIKPLIADLHHPQTLHKILEHLSIDYLAITGRQPLIPADNRIRTEVA